MKSNTKQAGKPVRAYPLSSCCSLSLTHAALLLSAFSLLISSIFSFGDHARSWFLNSLTTIREHTSSTALHKLSRAKELRCLKSMCCLHLAASALGRLLVRWRRDWERFSLRLVRVLRETLSDRNKKILDVHCSLRRGFHVKDVVVFGVLVGFFKLHLAARFQIGLVTSKSDHDVRVATTLQLLDPRFCPRERILLCHKRQRTPRIS